MVMSVMTADKRAPIVVLGYTVLSRVMEYKGQAREYFYTVTLSGHRCPRCGGTLSMLAEGRCRCQACRFTFDPTVTFQRCSTCDGRPRLRVRHYECAHCRAEVVSRFLFDQLVVDAAYFRQKMAESRQRRHERRLQIQQLVQENRSPGLLPGPADLSGMTELVAALNSLSAGAPPVNLPAPRPWFDLKRYEAHVRAQLGSFPLNLEQIPPLSPNTRLDRIGRFIAIIFLAHAGAIHVWQEQATVWVSAC